MKKYRLVIRRADGRKLTRHVRAVDKVDAHRQADVIASAQPARERGQQDVHVVSVVEMGNA